MIYFINGLQWSGYKRFDWSIVGESACADSWGRALKTREPSLSIPCFAERRYGGVLDDEMLMALPPDDIAKAITGMEALSATPAEAADAHSLPRALSCGRRSASGSTFRGGSVWHSPRSRLGPGPSFQGSEIAERDDANEAFILAHYGQAADPPTPHLFRYFLYLFALETIQHVGGHRLTYGGRSRVRALHRDLHGDIMAGDCSDQPIVFADRERSGIEVRHQTRRGTQTVAGAHRVKVRRHHVGYFHTTLPSPPSEASHNRQTSVENHSSRSRRGGIGAARPSGRDGRFLSQFEQERQRRASSQSRSSIGSRCSPGCDARASQVK
jgi:hypothetical protein